MAIGAIELQGTIARTNDYAQLRHTEDNKSAFQQAGITADIRKATDVKQETVNRNTGKDEHMEKFDAKEKGSNEYSGDGKRHNKKEEAPDGKVVIKGTGSSFDVRI